MLSLTLFPSNGRHPEVSVEPMALNHGRIYGIIRAPSYMRGFSAKVLRGSFVVLARNPHPTTFSFFLPPGVALPSREDNIGRIAEVMREIGVARRSCSFVCESRPVSGWVDGRSAFFGRAAVLARVDVITGSRVNGSVSTSDSVVQDIQQDFSVRRRGKGHFVVKLFGLPFLFDLPSECCVSWNWRSWSESVLDIPRASDPRRARHEFELAEGLAGRLPMGKEEARERHRLTTARWKSRQTGRDDQDAEGPRGPRRESLAEIRSCSSRFTRSREEKIELTREIDWFRRNR